MLPPSSFHAKLSLPHPDAVHGKTVRKDLCRLGALLFTCRRRTALCPVHVQACAQHFGPEHGAAAWGSFLHVPLYSDHGLQNDSNGVVQTSVERTLPTLQIDPTFLMIMGCRYSRSSENAGKALAEEGGEDNGTDGTMRCR